MLPSPYRTAFIALSVALISSLSGCSSNAYRERYQDLVKFEVGQPNAGISTFESGVFLDEESRDVRAKYVARPMLSMLDDIAYKSGFSYTVLSDLSSLRVSIFETDKHGNKVQKRFDSPESLMSYATKAINEQFEKDSKPIRLVQRWSSDGPELGFIEFLENKPGNKFVCPNPDELDPAKHPLLSDQECQAMSFKKIFLNNTSSGDALKSLYGLFPNEIEGKLDDALNSSDRLKLNRSFVVEYKPQNALIVRGVNRQVYNRIAKLLPALDADFNQVVVETKVFQYDDSVGQKIGAKLTYVKGNLTVSTPFSEGTSAQLPNLLYQFTSPDNRSNLLTQLAMEDKDGLVRILAEPRLVLQSGTQANVKLETKKYFLTSGVNVAGDLRELPSGIDFTVTPTVLGDSKIKLDLLIKQSEFALNNETGVAATTNANEIKTTIVANDGELVSLGGILTRKDANSSSGMTGIRKVPLLGRLFGSEAESSSIARIEFLIRPTISRSRQKNREFVKAAQDTNCMLESRMGGKGCIQPTDKIEGVEIK